MAQNLGDMPVDEFRAEGHAVVDWIADYLEQGSELPVLSRVRPGQVRAALASAPPQKGEDAAAILRDVGEVILPGLTHWNQPGFMAYFPNTGSGPGILGEMLAAGLNVNGMVWRSSPAFTELEEVTLDWVRQMLGLPEMFGQITDTASASTLYALAAARERATKNGIDSRQRVYCSREANSSVGKAVLTLGLGREGLHTVDTDEALRMDAARLSDAIARDRAAGNNPVAVVATVGTTSTAAIDPVDAIADICERERLWLHVDAAYGGVAAIVPEKRYVLRGCARAQSIVVNPHKWLFVPMDCSLLYTSDPQSLRDAFTQTGEYLRTTDPGVTNLMDYGLSLGRRFRALKLWYVLRYFGVDGITARLREHMRLAAELAAWVDTEPDFERLADVHFSTVVFRYAPRGVAAEDRNSLNERLLEGVNATGISFLSGTRVRGSYAIRVAIGNIRTMEAHVRKTWETIRVTAEGL